MATPDSYLPPALTADAITNLIVSLDLPKPTSTEPLEVTAAFHSIYLVHFPSSAASSIPEARPEKDGTLTFVLRVSGRQLPGIKTLNEVGVMSWVRNNTHIPVPAIIRYDATEDNLIGHEFTLLEKAPGVSVDKVYDTLSTETKTKMVHQLTEYLIELHANPWKEGYVGGLVLRHGEIACGPPIDENFWQVPDLQNYWSSSSSSQTGNTAGINETLETLNPIPTDGFTSYVAFNVCCMERYIHAIEAHPSLEPYRDMVPRLQAFITALQAPEHIDELNQVAYVLAHKDMHFANIMCDPDEPGFPITAVLDWEFSGVVPAPRWNPPRAFLWNTKWTPEDKAEQTRMEELFQQVCREKGVGILEEMEMNALQESMQTVVNHIRAIVEVCPRGQANKDRVASWRGVAEAAMEAFDV